MCLYIYPVLCARNCSEHRSHLPRRSTSAAAGRTSVARTQTWDGHREWAGENCPTGSVGGTNNWLTKHLVELVINYVSLWIETSTGAATKAGRDEDDVKRQKASCDAMGLCQTTLQVMWWKSLFDKSTQSHLTSTKYIYMIGSMGHWNKDVAWRSKSPCLLAKPSTIYSQTTALEQYSFEAK